MSRDDMSTSLIHFTRGETAEDYEGAFSRLLTIVSEGVLRGSSTGFIRGGYSCVCFSEAPLVSVKHGLINSSDFGRYSPFGLMFEKTWVFVRGGRPVIYEPEREFEHLPESLRWRHVRYDLVPTPHIDFTWEREWRVSCPPNIGFEPRDAVLIVPSRDWADRFVGEHQASLIESYSDLLDDAYAGEYFGRAAFPWRIRALDES